jgi:hypothetical protein
MTFRQPQLGVIYGSGDRALQECNLSTATVRGLRRHPPAPGPTARGRPTAAG